MGASFGSGCHAETDERRRSSSASRGQVARRASRDIPVGVGPRLVDRRETERGRARIQRLLVGDEPRALLWLALPTALALVIDLWLRAGTLAGYALQGKAIYGSSLLISAAFWLLPSWVIARSFAALR
jgi:hypothetical protein